MRRECSKVFSDTEWGFPYHYYEIFLNGQWVKIPNTIKGFAFTSGQQRWLLKSRGLVFNCTLETRM